MIITWKIETLVMECLCLFIHLTIWRKNLFHICCSLSQHARHSRTYSVTCFMNYCMLLYSRNYAAGIHRNCHESSDCFAEYPKKSFLKSSYPKKYKPKFSYLKRSRDQKFTPSQKNPSIFPVTWNLEYSPWARGYLFNYNQWVKPCG